VLAAVLMVFFFVEFKATWFDYYYLLGCDVGTLTEIHHPQRNKTFKALVLKMWSTNFKESAISSQGIRGYNSEIATLKFKYLFN